MILPSGNEITGSIIEKAMSLGASIVGIAGVDLVKQSPSHLIYPKMERNTGVGSRESAGGIKPGQVAWPDRAKSAVVMAVEHNEDQPELDWWYGKKSPPGNRILMKINQALSAWIEETYQIKTHKLPYHVEKGGIFLKDAAVMAGLGCVGKNNILITPEFGPRVRLRALLLESEIASTGPADFDPCINCAEFCRQACPQGAYDKHIFDSALMAVSDLPGRDGTYSRSTCNMQMQLDIDAAQEDIDPQSGQMEKIIKYCRCCELACPIGQRKSRG